MLVELALRLFTVAFEAAGSALAGVGAAVTAVARTPRSRRVLAATLLGVATLLCGRAEAQREVVEDSGAEAEAPMARGENLSVPAPCQLSYPSAPPAAARTLSRHRRRIMERDAEVARLAEIVAWARSGRAGPLELSLRAPEGLDWVWLGRDGEPESRWSFVRGPSLCESRCTLRLPAGSYHLAVRNSSHHGAIAEPVRIDSSGVLEAHYESRNARRWGGLALMLLGGPPMVGAGGIMMLVGALCDSRADRCIGRMPIGYFVGFGLAATSFVLGLIALLTSRRHVRLEFRPRAQRDAL